MSLNDQIYGILRTQGAEACQRFLDERAPGQDSDDRRTIASWRAILLGHENRNAEAVDVLNAANADFRCRSSFALQKAQFLRGLGRIPEAIATLKAAPITEEVATFPGLAWEAAYFCCYLMKKQGETPPPDLLDLIPDDFETMLDGRFLSKSNLLDGKL